MANTGAPNSGGSQFFINTVHNVILALPFPHAALWESSCRSGELRCVRVCVGYLGLMKGDGLTLFARGATLAGFS